MKIDRTKIKRSTTEVPPDCKVLIDKLKACNLNDKLYDESSESAIIRVLENVKTWTFGKCELYHWIDVLDLFDSVLQKATERKDSSCVMACDVNDRFGPELQQCVKKICIFTSLLIEHSFSRTLYNSMEHLTALLNSIHMPLVLEVLHLLYMFSKRSNFLTRLSEDKRDVLLGRLVYLAESWGGKEAGFGLAACCLQQPIDKFPSTATTVHLEFVKGSTDTNVLNRWKQGEVWQVIHLTNVDMIPKTPAEILDDLIEKYQVPQEKQLVLFTHIRLAYNFPKWTERVQLVQARLQALSILVYANAIQDNTQQLLYSGLMEELVDVLELDKPYLTEIKAAALKTLTSIIHLDRAQNFPNIIDATGAGSYHGFLPVMVRTCIASLTNPKPEETQPYPLPLATALFSFLYHLASYELGGEALVNCGMLESLLKVVNWNTVDVEHITFVTRAVRVIDLITNMDMQAFQAHNGLAAFISRLEMEVNACRKDQPFEIVPRFTSGNRQNSVTAQSDGDNRDGSSDIPMDTDTNGSQSDLANDTFTTNAPGNQGSAANFVPNGTTCLPQRAALLKSMLNFLKKVIQDPAFSDGIRHIMEGPLPNSLKHIISNAEYYGASLFLLATDVVTVYVFQEPSLLSNLQDSGLTDVVSEALLVKDVPPTREVISSMPNVFSALCLNSRGLNAFIKYNPFRKLFRILISPEYLPAMRRRRTAEPMGDTASNLGNAMDELMRHQPSLKIAATTAIVDLLQELCHLGSSARPFVKTQYKPAVLSVVTTNARSGASEGGSSDEEDEDEEETSTASHTLPVPSSSSSREEVGQENPVSSSSVTSTISEDKAPIPYMDYVLNVMKCLDAILSNNSTDDHCREFVVQGGLGHLITILSKPTVPLDFPNSPACQATASVCRSILTLAHEEEVLHAGIQGLHGMLDVLSHLGEPLPAPGSSVLLRELARSKNPVEAMNDCFETPHLHAITSVHSMVMMFIHVCRTGQSDIRTMAVGQWGSPLGTTVLKELSKLYLNLVWESTVLLALCSGEYQPGTNEFGRKDLDKLIPPDSQKETEVSYKAARDVEHHINSCDSEEQMATSSNCQGTNTDNWQDNLSTENMEVDGDSNSTAPPVLVNSSTQTTQPQQREINNLTLQNYAKLIKPILSASSRLGRALAELFGLLVKLCVGSPLRQRRGHHMPQIPGSIVPGAPAVATILAELLTAGLSWEPKPNSPVPRITFSICAVGFSAPLLFDEKKFPYHLMLRRFTDCDGLNALFDTFYWAMEESYQPKTEFDPLLSEHQMEFLESWLTLLEKFTNPKTNLDSQHLLLAKAYNDPKCDHELEASAFLAHLLKRAFDAVQFLWGRCDVKWYGPRSVETMLTILCHVFRFKQLTKDKFKAKIDSMCNQLILQQRQKENDREARASSRTSATAASSSSSTAPAADNNADNNVATSAVSVREAERPSTSNSESTTTVPTVTPPTASTPTATEPPANTTESGQASTSEAGEERNSSTTAGQSQAEAEAFAAALELGVDQRELRHLMEMGFPAEMCLEALVSCNSLLQATDYLLVHGGTTATTTTGTAAASGVSGSTSTTSTSADNNTTVTSRRGSTSLPRSITIGGRNFPISLGAPQQSTMDWDESTEERRIARLLLYLGDSKKTTFKSEMPEPMIPKRMEAFGLPALQKEEVDLFTDTVLEQCLSILDKIPDSVFRVCELLVAVGQRNGMPWMEKTLRILANKIAEGMQHFLEMIRKDPKFILNTEFVTETKPLGHRIHLFTLMFEELRYLSAMVMEATKLKPAACDVLMEYDKALNFDGGQGPLKNQLMRRGVLHTPTWIAPLFLMIDLYEKASVASVRRLALSEETNHEWKWFDINSGKWCPYSGPNNGNIDRAFWEGESTVRIIAGRRRYVINFNAMIQLNEETSNRRPITIWLKQKPAEIPKESDSDGDLPNETRRPYLWGDSQNKLSILAGHRVTLAKPKKFVRREEEEREMPYVRKQVPKFQGLERHEIDLLINCSVSFMKSSIEPEFLHAVMRLCLRLTRNYEVAMTFASLGGVQVLLELTQNSGFPGVLPLSNLLIRHVIEDPSCLKYAIEKMIRAKALSTGASTCKELHYLLRVLAPIACRSPDLFVSVAKDILRIDVNFVTRREDDLRLIAKPIPCKPENLITYMGESARKVIQQLLVALTLNNLGDEDTSKDNSSTSVTTSVKKTNAQQTNPSVENEELMETDVAQKSSKEKDSKNEANELLKKRRLVPKDAICQLLAESVHSYSYSCKIIAEYSFQGGTSLYVPEDCTALAFLLDRMLPSTQTVSEKDCSTVVRDLISAMAGCNHLPEAQAIVISEVKAALQRALAMKECPDKHNRIQALAGLICNMIEACPSSPPTQMVSVIKPTQLCMNQVVRLLIRKSVVVDLTRISHSLDLSSPQMAATVNAALKPLEVISRIVNQPLPTNNPTRPKPKTESTAQDSANNTHTGGTSNSEMTHAQGEETVEDADNTEHDISAAAESLLDATTESIDTHDHDIAGERDDDVLDEIMDQLLDRENNTRDGDLIVDAIMVETTNNRMDTEQDENRDAREYGESRFEVDHDDNDTSDSDTGASDSQVEDDDDDEDGNGNNVGDDDDDDDEEEEEEDDDDAASNFDTRDQEFMDEGFMRFPGMDRDEDLLVVQYGQDENTPVFFTNNTSYNLNVGLFDDPLINEQTTGLRLNHPLLTPPMTDPPATGTVASRGHRTGRTRRYQYIHFPRNPPAVIQRLLGPSTAQEVIQLTSGQSLNQGIGLQNQARVLVMDASADQAVTRNGTSGSNNSLSNYTALHWWCEEAKALDGESMHDCVVSIKRAIVEAVEDDRDKNFKLRREKKVAEEQKRKMEAAKEAAQEAANLKAAEEKADATANVDSQSNSSQTTTTIANVEALREITRQSEIDTWRIHNDSREHIPPDFDRMFPPPDPPIQNIATPAAAAAASTSDAAPNDEESDMELATEEPVERDQATPSLPPVGTSSAGRSRTSRGRRQPGGAAQAERRVRRPGLRSATRAAATASMREQQSTGPSIFNRERAPTLSPPHTTSSSSEQQQPFPPPFPYNLPASTNLSPLTTAEIEEDLATLQAAAAARFDSLTNNETQSDNNASSVTPVSVNITTGPSGGEEPVAGPSGTQSVEDYRNILGDIDVPEGVDPSFLAALPEEMRQEVISEHLRLQRLRQRAQAVQEVATNISDVNPEFLAALPPNIQEEVLAQQRMEQQRRVATASNPNDPVDTEAFFRNLQPSLRQAILADMEESQIAVLPPELAAEAQNLRREWESRNRQLLQDRFFTHSHHASTTLSSILRNSGMRLSSRYGLHNMAQRAQWSSQWPRGPAAVAAHHMLMSSKIKGKQLVDNETLSCLLVLLFLDDPRLNTGRLHRVLRNLCYHANTRQWVIKSLLSVMERANECSMSPHGYPALPGTSASSCSHVRRSHDQSMFTEQETGERHVVMVTPSWLNLSLDAALGCRASVFEIHKTSTGSGKRTGLETRVISIHAQAVPSISRHTLDVLSNLAKSFPAQFLPTKAKPNLYCLESSSKVCNLVERKPTTPPPELKLKSPTTPCSSSSKSKAAAAEGAEFWDLLLKLDSATSTRKGKNIPKGHSNTSVSVDQGNSAVTFEASPFGLLINMLSYGCVRRSTLLTDKLLRLLSLISLGIPDTSGYGRKVLLEEPETPQDTSILITESHLRLIVDVITSKSCSEEGLEEATSLLLNLSYGPPSTRDKILNLLMEGVRELGCVVCGHITSLQTELKSMRKEPIIEGADDVTAGTSDPDGDKLFKGTLIDRFTKDAVVIQSSNKAKAAYELQLPSMAALTSKTSSQAFFLRLLKVIISLREAIRLAIKKHKLKGGSIGGPLMSSTVMSSIGERSLISAVAAGMSESASQRLREVFRRVVNSELNEEQPMDVDQDQMETNESRPTARRSGTGFPALVDIDESSDEEVSEIPETKDKSNLQDSVSELKEAPTIDESKLLPRLSGLLDLDKLWEALSQCLLELGHTPDHHAVLVLQPAVEAFFLVHASASDKEEKKTSSRESREAQLAHLQQDLPPVSPIQAGDGRIQGFTDMIEIQNSTMLDITQSSCISLSPDTQKFLKFAETHRTVLNQILRQSTTHLADGPFSVLVDHTRVLDFDVKRRYFRTELERLDEGVRREDLAVHVRRSAVFEDSFRELHRRSAEEWKNRFYIVFEGEEGQDAGGLLREWYVIISREIFNPMYALFTISPGDRVTYMINPSSHCNSNHLFYFKFVGRVIAKAIYDNKLLECYFTRSFYKHILGKPVKYTDMESEDYSFYQGLAFLIENIVADLGYELTFSTEVQEFGVTEVRDLIPNGRNIPVSEENKMEYIRLVCQMKMTGAIRKQLNAFLEGFYDIIPKRLISIFNEQELELLVSGLPNIDIEDLKSNTEYHKYQPNSLQIQWFWRALRSFDQADRAKFLQFVTGTSKVPLQGFGALEGMNGVQKFQIHRDDRSTDRLPSAHTCFNQLDLPAYETYDKLKSYLLKAIHECSEGFGFA